MRKVVKSEIKIFRSLQEIDPGAWDRLSDPNFPFSDFAYLSALESSGCVGEKTGWDPYYVTVWESDRLAGATYLYAKMHSYGEYIFDWEWARAYQQFRVPYYPKLLSAVPFTPATGAKLLIEALGDRQSVAASLIAGSAALQEKIGAHSLHFLFIPENETPFYESQGLVLRHSFQYHWKNHGYADFAAFLGALKSRKRKQIVKERSEVAQSGLAIVTFTGDALTPEFARRFFLFYLATISKMGAIPYLTESFFETIFLTMADRILLIVAKRGEEWVAGTLNYFKGNSLFGRYWGAAEEVRNLHFELCYYRTIEFAIARGLSRFEAGAQGEHKLARGFLPSLTYSAHDFAHPQFKTAINEFILKEKDALAGLFAQIQIDSPFSEIIS